MTDTGGIAQDVLRSFIDRIERLEEEKKDLAADISDIYSEAKSSGFDPKILKKIVAMRQKDENDRMEEEAITDLYAHAIDMRRGTEPTPMEQFINEQKIEQSLTAWPGLVAAAKALNEAFGPEGAAAAARMVAKQN